MVAVSHDLKLKYSCVATEVLNLRYLTTMSPHVFNVFVNRSGLDKERAIGALMLHQVTKNFDWIPSVSVAAPGVIPGYARYPDVGNNILLGPGFVLEFETLMKIDAARGYNPIDNTHIEEPAFDLFDAQRSAKLLMQSKLLHELVHWGRRQSELPSGPQRGAKEEGWLFERQAYGRHIVSSGLKLNKYISDW